MLTMIPVLLRSIAMTLTCTFVLLSAADDTTEQHVAVEPETVAVDRFTAQIPAGAAVITVGTQPRQTFQGLGVSTKAGWARGYGQLSPERRAVLSDALWTQARMTTMRVWFVMKDYAPDAETRHLDKVMPAAQIQLLRDAQARGLRHLSVGPCGIPTWIRQTEEYPHRDGTMHTRPSMPIDKVETFANVLADFIRDCRDQHGLTFATTGIMNEPNTGNDCYFSSEAMVEAVKHVRRALDARGLTEVGIIGPETASADRIAYQMVDALKADPEAWAALEGISTHSYNMAVTERLAALALKEGKSYWQTESSVPGREEAGDVYRATLLSATVLSDLNHAVTHWIHFIGYAPNDPRDNGTRVIAFDPKGDDDSWYTVFRKHLSFTQLARAFDPGTVMRKSTSSLDRDMVWTYGRKPRVIAAAGINPDGTWAVGITNFTANRFPDRTGFQRDNAGHVAQDFAVTVIIPELAEVPRTTFQVWRSGTDHELRSEEAIVAEGGRLDVLIRPMELVTLRSVP